MPFEHPPLGESFVVSYDNQDTSFPIIGIAKDPTASGYAKPADLAVHPETAKYPNHKFIQVKPTESDKRVLWIYEILPGPATSEASIDPETNAAITKTRTKKLISAITTGASIVGSTVVVIDKADIDANTAWELKTIYALPAAHDLNSAVASVQFRSQKFPGRIDLAALDLYGTAIGYNEPYAEVVETPTYTYWVISATRPAVTFDRIIPDSIVINGVSYSNVLHDATVRNYNGFPVFIPATTPSYTQYIASWVGTPRLIDGDVTPTKYQLLWRVRLFKPTMQ